MISSRTGSQWQARWDDINVSFVGPLADKLRSGIDKTGFRLPRQWSGTVQSDLGALLRGLSVDDVGHALRTAELARKLAVVHGADVARAVTAALLHDVAERYPDTELLALAAQYAIPVSESAGREPSLLHGAVGAEILRRECGVSDDQILAAVHGHGVGSVDAGPISKIVFLADVLEPGNGLFSNERESLCALACRRLDEAVWRVVDCQRGELQTLATRLQMLATN